MKVAVCIPVYGDTRSAFTKSLSRMLMQTAGKYEMELFMVTSSSISENRKRLVADAKEWGADWILWLDADQTFPPETLDRLLGHGLDAVGCNYPVRNGRRPVASSPDGKPVWTTKAKAEANEIELVGASGLGVFLVSMRAIGEIDGDLFIGPGEDAHFCKRLAVAGYAPHVDHGLSWQVGHVQTHIAGNADIEPKTKEVRINVNPVRTRTGAE